LKDKGKAKRAIFAVPSVVQAQFGNEVNVFCKPGKYRVKSDPGLSQEERIKALKDGNTDMVVMTHQGLRDDLIHIMAQHHGLSDNAMKDKFNAMKPEERVKTLGESLNKEGIKFDMLTVDESHYTMNRKGKEDATLANVLDALNQNVEYFMNQSATPVKNDASEAFDMLHKVDPKRFNDRDEFLKKYGVDPEFSKRSLQRLIDRYNYSSKTVTGTVRHDYKEDIDLTPEQQGEYQKVLDMFKRASKANRAGQVDIEAMKYLSPNSFKNVPEDKHAEIARRLQQSAGVIKEEALNRVVNQFDWHKNAKVQKLMDIVNSKVYESDNPKTNAKKGDRKPGVIFTHNLATVENLRQALSEKGLRVGIIQGAMDGAKKEEVKVGFNPPNPKDRKYDVLICSDAGATGLNLQNAGYLVNFDLPQTAWVKQQREGRIDRPGQAHSEIDYHDLVTNTEHEKTKWERIERKKKLGSIFEEDPGILDDTGLAATIANIRQDRYNKGLERVAA
jgi:SNF2 family DNA or RNA helicase